MSEDVLTCPDRSRVWISPLLDLIPILFLETSGRHHSPTAASLGTRGLHCARLNMGSGTEKELWQLSAAEVLPLLRTGELTAAEYVRSLVRRIQGRDNDVKAWVFFSPGQVLQQAQRLDDLPLAQRGPLHGLPVAVKDVILTKDMPTQYNSPLFESEVPIGADANCVASLRAAGELCRTQLCRPTLTGGLGAIIFGKTSTTEFATSKQGNWHQNLTTNVNDPKRTPGGSSSGSGAAVGDFQVPVALGTQVCTTE